MSVVNGNKKKDDDDINGNNKSSSSTTNNNNNWHVHETKQDYSFIPTLAVTLWLGWMGILVYTTILMIIVPGLQTLKLIILGFFVLSLCVSRHFPGKNVGNNIIGKWIMINAEKYFGLKTTIENPLEFECEQKAYIFATEPHDILPYSVFAFNPSLQRLPGRIGATQSALMTGAIFNIPIIKQVYTWVGGAPVDKKTFKRRLERKESFTFVPGGVQEVTMMNPNRPNDLLLYLKNRKGFIKMAISTKSPIVPVFVFNLDGSYRSYIPRGSLMNKISRIIGFVPVLFTGRFYIPFGIPNPQQIHVVIGKPIHIVEEESEDENESNEANNESSSDNNNNNNSNTTTTDIKQETIDKYHQIYIKELTALYDRHKNEAGYGHRNLVIV